jgi:hypothetical protein
VATPVLFYSTPYPRTLQIPLACQRQLQGTLSSLVGGARFTGYKRERMNLLATIIRQFKLPSSSGTCDIFISIAERTLWFTNLAIEHLVTRTANVETTRTKLAYAEQLQ